MGLFNRTPKEETELFHRREFVSFKNQFTTGYMELMFGSALIGVAAMIVFATISSVIFGFESAITIIGSGAIYLIGGNLLFLKKRNEYAREQAEHHRQLNAEKRGD